MFNWIKYKTLPASFLFRNRLYVERDSKHKRIFSNFGSNFKGSKWSFYLSYSIKTLFKDKYVKYTIKFLLYLIIFIVFFIYNKYYIKMPLLNSFFYFIWSCADCTHYYLTFAAWWIFVGFIKMASIFSSALSFNNFSRKILFNFLERPFEDFDLPEESLYRKKLISREDVDYYSNLWTNITKTTLKPAVLGNMFNDETSPAEWAKKHNFFKLNNLLINFSNKVSSQVVSYRVNRKLNKILIENCNGNYDKLDKYISQTDFYQNHLTLCLLFFFKRKTYFEIASKKFNSTRLLDQKNDWNLCSILKEEKTPSFLRRSKIGSFFFKQTNQKEILDFVMNSDELKTIESEIKENLQSAKFQRWLYRYSILHRKSFKFTNKIAAAKANSLRSAWGASLYNKDLWRNFSKFRVNGLFKTPIFFTGDISASRELNRDFKIHSDAYKNNAHSFYETSYLWVIKKFYFFSASNAAAAETKFTKIFINFSKNMQLKRDSLRLHIRLLSLLSKSSTATLNMYSLNDNIENLTSLTSDMRSIFKNSPVPKDLYAPFDDFSLLNGGTLKNNLISYSALNDKQLPTFIFYVLNQNEFDASSLEQLIFTTDDVTFEEIAMYYMYNEKNIDKIFIEDFTDLLSNLPKSK